MIRITIMLIALLPLSGCYFSETKKEISGSPSVSLIEHAGIGILPESGLLNIGHYKEFKIYLNTVDHCRSIFLVNNEEQMLQIIAFMEKNGVESILCPILVE